MIVDIKNIGIDDDKLKSTQEKLKKAYDMLIDRNGAGSEFTGWMDYSYDNNTEEYERIKKAAARIMSDSEAVIVIGIGGSYLGTRATITALNGEYHNDFPGNKPRIFFCGNNLNEKTIINAKMVIENYNTSLIAISKSGTTIEPAIAFRLLKHQMCEKYGDKAKDRIYVITDKKSGALRKTADYESMESFVVPDDIGGRYSVFTPVGLLPIACAGIDIDEMMRGLKDAQKELLIRDFQKNPAFQYAAARYALGKSNCVEILVNYSSELSYIAQWWQQLFGESEGKAGNGLYPTSLNYTTDLHSMGQFIQDGNKIFFETNLIAEKNGYNVCIPHDENNFDKLNYLSGNTVDFVNKAAFEGTFKAHLNGKVPSIVIKIPEINAYNIAKLYYFFMLSCALSAYMIGVNPFDQPGVEEYKKNMKELLVK